MSNLYTSLLDIAKLDYNAATVLTSNGLFAQALFYAEQSFEKANKSVIVYYETVHRGIKQEEVDRELKKEFGHFNRRATAKVLKLLIDKEKEKYLSMGGSENDEFITKPYELLEEFQKSNFKEDLIPYFNNAINRIYYNYYIQFSGKTKNESIDPKIRYLRDQYTNPTSKYQSLSWLLSSYLDGLEIYARYPIKEHKYNNIKFLNIPENKNACHLLLEMIDDFLDVVPLIWEKIVQLPDDKEDLDKVSRPEATVTEADVVSFYNDVQQIITQNLAPTAEYLDNICKEAKAWLTQSDGKSPIFPPLLTLSLEFLARQRSVTKLKPKVEARSGLSYNNGSTENISMEHDMLMLAIITMSWTIRNLKGKVEVGSCHNLQHEHGSQEPRLCTIGSQFHKGFYDECLKTFEDIVKIAKNSAPKALT